MKKLYTIEFSYRKSVKPTVNKYKKIVPVSDLQDIITDEFVNVFVQQMCLEYKLNYEDFSTPDDESKQYRIGWSEEEGIKEICFCFPDEEQFKTVVDRYYNKYLYTFMSVAYNNYYDIDVDIEDRTLITFNDKVIKIELGVAKDFFPNS